MKEMYIILAVIGWGWTLVVAIWLGVKHFHRPRTPAGFDVIARSGTVNSQSRESSGR